MRIFIAAVMLLVAFALPADAQKRSSKIGSGNFSTVRRYYGANGRTVLTERRYSDRSYFYGPNGLKTGERVNGRR